MKVKVTQSFLGFLVPNGGEKTGFIPCTVFFFLEYAKDLRVIVIKKKSLTIQTDERLGGLPV
jgi:hypothetical protein